MRDDRELVSLARAGDREAFAALVARHADLLRATTRRAAGGDAELAADAAQEAVLTAMLNLDRLRDPRAFGAWLAGIGLNATRHALRDRRTAPPPAAVAAPVHASADDVDATLDDRAVAKRIRRAIAALPPGQREAVTLFYLAGLTHAEAAEHLDIPPSAVKARLHKARATLEHRLRPLWKEQFAMSDLVPMHVAEVRRSSDGGHHLVMLAEDDPGEGRRLPIWVGLPEAFAIAGLLERVELPRPGPYDFAAALLRASHATVTEVRVSRLAENVFYADVVLGDGTTIDARPSDALSLALTTGTPIRVAAEVLDQATDVSGEAGALATARVAGVEYDDQVKLATETRERLARQAQELRRENA